MKLQSARLSALVGVKHAFFTREGGVSDGIYSSLNGGTGSRDRPELVAENRARMARFLEVAPDRLLGVYQVHSADVVVAEGPWPGQERPRADAIVTRVPGLAIGVSTADCGPLLLADAAAGVVGATHAGWRGALGGVIEATVAAMERLGARRAAIVAAAGPMISQRNYEVGADLMERFAAEDAESGRFFAPGERPGHAQFDLPGYVVSRLERCGVGAIEDMSLCTYADPERFYSYRRTTHRGEPDYGRHINAIALAG